MSACSRKRRLDLGQADELAVRIEHQGSEVPALRGAAETIRRFKPRLAVGTYHRPGDLAGVERAVLDVRSDYQIVCSRCLEYNGRIFPLLLYFK